MELASNAAVLIGGIYNDYIQTNFQVYGLHPIRIYKGSLILYGYGYVHPAEIECDGMREGDFIIPDVDIGRAVQKHHGTIVETDTLGTVVCFETLEETENWIDYLLGYK